MKFPRRAGAVVLTLAGIATLAAPVSAADGEYGGNGNCYYNDAGGACSDLNGNGYWTECESGFGSGTKSEQWAAGHCGGGWHSGA